MKILYILAAFFFLATSFNADFAFALEYYQVAKDQTNVRVDSSVGSDSLGFVSKDDQVEVVGEKFDWYRIILPKTFPCYIFKNLTEKLDQKTIRVTATKVNLRAKPSLESKIIGQAPELEIFPLLESSGDWLRIENNSHAKGWIHKSFLNKPSLDKGLALAEAELASSDPTIIYRSIAVLSQIGKDNLELVVSFLEKAESSPIREASIYLDVLQNILRPEGEREAYFYRFQNKSLSSQDVNEALILFQKLTVN